MIELNLLPDVKMQFINARRREHLVIVITLIVTAASVAVFVFLLLFVEVAQKVTINNVSNNIKQTSSQLIGNTKLNEVLTVQNQLETLPNTEAATPAVTRMFNYVAELTPLQATISDLKAEYSSNQVTITGSADSLSTVNLFVDTLKYVTYTDTSSDGTGGQSAAAPAFNTVVLSSFNYATSTTNNTKPASYTITFNYDPPIFDASKNITLNVPQETTTRSILNQPDLFKANTTPTNKGS